MAFAPPPLEPLHSGSGSRPHFKKNETAPMKKLVLAATFVAAGLLGQDVTFAHGGNYRGPGDTVPPGGGGSGGGGAGPAPGPSGPSTPGGTGPSSPTPLAPGSPAGSTASSPTSGSPGNSGPDLTLWSYWWEFNKEPYLNLKSMVWGGGAESGTDGFFLGRGEQAKEKDSLRPTPQQIRDKVVPALLKALETETNNDIVTGAMIALAKIGDVKSEAGESAFEQVIARFLSDKVQEISETAAVSLGILANPKSIKTLNDLLQDNADGRGAVGSGEVPYRTRSFAAYGLGLIGASKDAKPEDRRKIVQHLAQAISSDQTSSRDLKVACIIAMGLCPIEQMNAPMTEGVDGPQAPDASRAAQLQYLMSFLADDTNNYLVRAHCPTALARLLNGIPAEEHTEYTKWRTIVRDDLLARVAKNSKEQNEVLQSAVLALGLIGTNGKDDKAIRDAIAAVQKDVSDQQTRNFSLIAMAKAGANPGEDGDKGVEEAGKFLMDQLQKGKSSIKPWAGLAIGVMCEQAARNNITHPTVTAMGGALRSALAEEGNNSNLSAYAIACGIMSDLEASGTLVKLLEKVGDYEARGYIALGLGLMNQRNAIEDIQRIITESKYRPELLKQAAIALGLLGDKELVSTLITMLNKEAKSLATQAAISSALGFIGDQRSIDPLVEMLENKDLTDRARGFAAVALGIVADKEPLPWNSKVAVDLNYRASTSTLVDSTNGTGILDIL